MNTDHIYTSDEKIAWWGYGEWVEEPDLVTFFRNGFQCCILRMSKMEDGCMYGGHLTAFVRLYDDPWIDRYKKFKLVAPSEVLFETLPDEKIDIVGFPCCDTYDYVPSVGMHYKNLNDPTYKQKTNYRNIEYCTVALEVISKQLFCIDYRLLQQTKNISKDRLLLNQPLKETSP